MTETRALVDQRVREFLREAEKHGLKTLKQQQHREAHVHEATRQSDCYRVGIGDGYYVHVWQDGTWKVLLDKRDGGFAPTGYVELSEVPARSEDVWRWKFERAMILEKARQVD